MHGGVCTSEAMSWPAARLPPSVGRYRSGRHPDDIIPRTRDDSSDPVWVCHSDSSPPSYVWLAAGQGSSKAGRDVCHGIRIASPCTSASAWSIGAQNRAPVLCRLAFLSRCSIVHVPAGCHGLVAVTKPRRVVTVNYLGTQGKQSASSEICNGRGGGLFRLSWTAGP